ncbi:MAG TPA: AI-2E family transporter [Vicinamibacterales bacterium]|nr:AI-2E family transporter [Vicinamibacterales bacterium]
MNDLFGVNRTAGRRVTDVRPGWADVWTIGSVVLIVLAALGALWLVVALGTIIVLVIFSLLFAYLLAPLVGFIERRLTFRRRGGLGRGPAIGIAYAIVFGAIALAVSWIAPRVFEQASEVAREAPARFEQARESGQPFGSFYDRVEQLGLSPALIERGVSAIASAVDSGVRQLGTAFVRLASYVPWLVVVPILAFFLLKDAATLRRGILELVPAGSPRLHADALLDRVDAALAAFIRAQLVACLLVGAVVGVGFTLMPVPYGAVLGVAAGLAEFVPLVGPLVIAIASAVAAALHSPMLAFWVLVFLGVLRVVEDYVIYPRLMGSNIHLHPLGVILAVLAGAELGGAVGVLLSVPALAIALAIYRYVVEFRGSESRTPRARPA